MSAVFFFVVAWVTASAAAHQPAAERPKVAATIPPVAAIVREVAGDDIEVMVLARSDEDPHFVQPTPLLMRRVRDAQALFEVGLLLEIWVDEVVRRSGNPRIQRGTSGHVILSQEIPTWEVPTRVGREQGDVHPQGNPHIWLDPVRAKMMARNAAAALQRLFPDRAEGFRTRLADFERRVDQALYGEDLLGLVGARTLDRYALSGTLQSFLETNFRGQPLRARAGGWLARAGPLRHQRLVEYHRDWVYCARLFGFEIARTVEEYPGIRPGPSHLRATRDLIRAQSLRAILIERYYPRDLADYLAAETGVRVAIIPMQPDEEAPDYISFFSRVVDELVKAVQ